VIASPPAFLARDWLEMGESRARVFRVEDTESSTRCGGDIFVQCSAGFKLIG